jgi:hypothetical protein
MNAPVTNEQGGSAATKGQHRIVARGCRNVAADATGGIERVPHAATSRQRRCKTENRQKSNGDSLGNCFPCASQRTATK